MWRMALIGMMAAACASGQAPGGGQTRISLEFRHGLQPAAAGQSARFANGGSTLVRLTDLVFAETGYDFASRSSRWLPRAPGGEPVEPFRDYSYFLPLGVRLRLPLRATLLEGGGGWAVAGYRERVRPLDGGGSWDCEGCRARVAQGWYAMAGLRWRPWRLRGMSLGGQVRVYELYPGPPLMKNPPAVGTDRRALISLVLGFGN